MSVAIMITFIFKNHVLFRMTCDNANLSQPINFVSTLHTYIHRYKNISNNIKTCSYNR